MLSNKEVESLLTERFAELLQEFYVAGMTDNEVSIKQFLEEMTEKLESLIYEYA